MSLAKQSTAKSFLVGPVLDADGVAKTDEVVGSIKVTKNGSVGAPNGSSTLTHNHTGHYVYAANAGDVDTLGEVEFSLNSGTNAMSPVLFQVVPANIYDSLVLGASFIQTDLAEIGGSSATKEFLEDLLNNALGADDKILISTDAQDLRATLDVAGDITRIGGVVANAEALANQYDGATGLSGATYPARQDQVNSIGSGATGGTHVEATYDNTTRDTIDNASADLKGGGLVGIPVTGHSFVTGREVTIAGTTNYNGAFDIVSQTADEVVITHAQDAEAFGGSETIVSSIKGEIFVGTITAGTFLDTAAPQGDLHSMDDDGDAIKIVYGFNVGGSRQATDAGLFFNVNGNADQMVLKAYNFVTQQYEAKRLMPGSGGTAFLPIDPPLLSRNTGTGTQIGDVFIFLDTVTTSPSSLDVDSLILTAAGTNLLIGYPNGFEISAAGTSGTEFGVNGTSGNPCPFADAVTMNTTHPLNLFAVHNGETVPLASNSDGITLNGQAWVLQLQGESIVGMHVSGASVSGTSTGSGSEFHDCDMGTCTIAPCSIIASRFTSKAGGGFTMQTAGTYIFHGCGSAVSGNDSPVFTFPGAGDTFISDRAGSGGRQYEGMSAGDLASVEGWGQFIEGTCSGGAVTIRGCMTRSGITSITLTDDARIDVDQIGDAVWDEVISTGAHNGAQSAGKRLRQVTSVVIANDTAEVGNSPAINQIQLASGESSVDGTFDPGIVGLIGGTGSGQSRLILEYKGSTRIATLNRDWKIAPDATTEYVIVASAGGLHVNEGLAQGGGPSTVTLNPLASATDDLYNGQFVFLVSGPGQDQVGRVTAYNGTSKIATIVTTMDGWATEPTSATGYIMVPILDTVPAILGTPAGNSVSADIAALNNISAADVLAQSKAALVFHNLDHFFTEAYDAASKPGNAAGWANEMVEDNAGVTRYTAAALAQAPSGGASAPDIADAVWDEVQSGHTAAGTFGKYVDAQISLIVGQAGSGGNAFTINVSDTGTGDPLDGVNVWVTTDNDRNGNIVASGFTNTAGQIVFMLEAGAFFYWRQLSTYDFDNPQTITVTDP